jgi:hypothetical protein
MENEASLALGDVLASSTLVINNAIEANETYHSCRRTCGATDPKKCHDACLKELSESGSDGKHILSSLHYLQYYSSDIGSRNGYSDNSAIINHYSEDVAKTLATFGLDNEAPLSLH